MFILQFLFSLSSAIFFVQPSSLPLHFSIMLWSANICFYISFFFVLILKISWPKPKENNALLFLLLYVMCKVLRSLLCIVSKEDLCVNQIPVLYKIINWIAVCAFVYLDFIEAQIHSHQLTKLMHKWYSFYLLKRLIATQRSVIAFQVTINE